MVRCEVTWANLLYNKAPISPLVARRLKHSAILAVFAFLVGVPAAVMAGILAGVRPGHDIRTA